MQTLWIGSTTRKTLERKKYYPTPVIDTLPCTPENNKLIISLRQRRNRFRSAPPHVRDGHAHAVELHIIIMIYDHRGQKDRFFFLFFFYRKRLFPASRTIVYRGFNSIRYRVRVRRKRITRTCDISTVQTRFRNAFWTSNYHTNGYVTVFFPCTKPIWRFIFM